MDRQRNTLYIGVALAVLLTVGSTSAFVGAAAAQSSNNNTTTTTPSPAGDGSASTATPTPSTESDGSIREQAENTVKNGVKQATGQNDSSAQQDCITVSVSQGESTSTQCVPTYHHRIDNSTQVVAVDWDGRTTTLVLQSDRYQRVSVVDTHSIKSSGSGDVTYAEKTLQPGQNVVRINAEEKSGDKTLTIGTSEDLDWISNPGQPFLANGLRTSLLYFAGLGGGIGTTLVMVLYVRYRARKMNNGWTDVLEEFTP